MRLCVSAVLLLLLALTRAAPGPGTEECSKYDILKDKTLILDRSHLMAAFTDNDFTRNMLGLIYSHWSSVTETQTGFREAQFYKMNGTCLESGFNITASGDKYKVQAHGMMTESQLFHLSNTSLIMDVRATAENLTTIAEKFPLNLSPSDASQGVKAHNLYLISKEPELNDMDLQRFRAYAKCEGFTGEPDFLRDSSQAYCTEEESVLIQ
uniref:Uncharacterized protein n=1 Tax=Neogobius melanostomus TaxID=47308 RepID=A0A8C6TF22_9GOBI